MAPVFQITSQNFLRVNDAPNLFTVQESFIEISTFLKLKHRNQTISFSNYTSSATEDYTKIYNLILTTYLFPLWIRQAMFNIWHDYLTPTYATSTCMIVALYVSTFPSFLWTHHYRKHGLVILTFWARFLWHQTLVGSPDFNLINPNDRSMTLCVVPVYYLQCT